MTDIDPATAERLARLGQRRPEAATTTAAAAVGQRRASASPAAASKVVAAGASAVAVLSMMAVFGQQTAASSSDEAATQLPLAAPLTDPADPLAANDETDLASTSSVLVLVDGASNSRVATLSPVEIPNRIQLAMPTPQQVVIVRPATARVSSAPAPAAAPSPAAPVSATPAPAPPAPVATSQGS